MARNDNEPQEKPWALNIQKFGQTACPKEKHWQNVVWLKGLGVTFFFFFWSQGDLASLLIEVVCEVLAFFEVEES